MTGGPDSPGKSQVAKCFLRNTGTDPPQEAIGPLALGSRGRTGGPDPSGKSQVAIGFLRNTGTDRPL